MYGEKVKKIAALQPLFTLDKFIIPTTKQGDQYRQTREKENSNKGDRTRTGLHGLSVQKDTNDDQKSDSVQDHTKSKENKQKAEDQLAGRQQHDQPHGLF